MNGPNPRNIDKDNMKRKYETTLQYRSEIDTVISALLPQFPLYMDLIDVLVFKN